MGTKGNKCCCPCLIAKDDFGRPDSATLGDKWIEDTDWNIVSGFAVKDAGDFLAIFDVPHPSNSGSMVVHYEIHSPVADAIYYLLVNVVDASNYHVAKYHHTSSPFIELYKVVGGVGTLLASEFIVGVVGNSIIKFHAWIAENEFCASTDNGTYTFVTADAALFVNGLYSGMGGKSTTTAQYDNFYFGHHSETRAGCGQCICHCEGKYVPPTLLATFSGEGRMLDLDGCTVTLEWDRENGYWSGVPACCGGASPSDELRLACGETLETWALYLVLGDCTGSDPIGDGERNPNANSTCDPFYLHFGPVQVAADDLVCACGSYGDSGTYEIEITEAP